MSPAAPVHGDGRFPLAVGVAVLDAEGRVLLTRREDFEVWCVPGGAVDDGESLAEAAVREVREETGLDVRLSRLVGLYSRPRFGGYHTYTLFAGAVVGGSLQLQPQEVLEARWFAADEIPGDLVWGERERIEDALGGRVGVVRSTDRERPDSLPRDRGEHYELRDRSGLGRAEFYRNLADVLGDDRTRVELDGAGLDR